MLSNYHYREWYLETSAAIRDLFENMAFNSKYFTLSAECVEQWCYAFLHLTMFELSEKQIAYEVYLSALYMFLFHLLAYLLTQVSPIDFLD